MIRKLRWRVAGMTICAVFIVLALLIGLINAVNYINKDRSAGSLLDIIADNGGVFPRDRSVTSSGAAANDGGKTPAGDTYTDAEAGGDATAGGDESAALDHEPDTEEDGEADVDSEPDSEEDSESDSQTDTQPETGVDPDPGPEDDTSTYSGTEADGDTSGDSDDADDTTGDADSDSEDDDLTGDDDITALKKINYTPETPYETRYFTVSFTGEGTVSAVNTDNIAAINSEQAASIAAELLADGKTSGYTRNYKYKMISAGSGSMYIFLDCTRDLESVMQFLRASILIAFIGFCAISLLVILLSPLMVKPIAESYEKQKSFITNAGHELKTPLAAIESCNEVIEMENGETKWTNGIRSQVNRLSVLTQELVELARMDERGYNIGLEALDFSELVEEALSQHRHAAECRGLKFDTEIRPGITVRGNGRYLTELINILADNAVKYSSKDGSIRFTLANKGRTAVLTAANPAAGLTAGRQTRFFDRFYRGNRETSGYGIGLSMARSIVLAHNGKIDAFSDGKILTIIVKL